MGAYFIILSIWEHGGCSLWLSLSVYVHADESEGNYFGRSYMQFGIMGTFCALKDYFNFVHFSDGRLSCNRTLGAMGRLLEFIKIYGSLNMLEDGAYGLMTKKG